MILSSKFVFCLVKFRFFNPKILYGQKICNHPEPCNDFFAFYCQNFCCNWKYLSGLFGVNMSPMGQVRQHSLLGKDHCPAPLQSGLDQQRKYVVSLYIVKQRIQTCKTGDKLYGNTSPNGECSLARLRNLFSTWPGPLAVTLSMDVC